MTHSSNKSIFDLSLGAASLFVTATVVLRWPCWGYRLSVISSRLWWRAETFLKLNAEAVWTLKPVFPVLFWQPRVHVQVCSVFLPLCSFGSAVFPRCCHSPRLHSVIRCQAVCCIHVPSLHAPWFPYSGNPVFRFSSYSFNVLCPLNLVYSFSQCSPS